MDKKDIARLRLRNQRLIGEKLKDPVAVVRWLGAVQSQDYAGGKWALGLRLRGATDADIEDAFNAGKILRTHALRPTWHFVTPEDIRWLLMLTAPRVNAVNAHMYRQLELSESVLKRSNAVLAKALQGGRQLTRQELAAVLERARIPISNSMRLGYIVHRAELDAVICSGARRGKQFTYALLEERAPAAKTLRRDEALALLTERYFSSRGPASAHDFAWWSGLTVTDARRGIELIKSKLDRAPMGEIEYWFSKSASSGKWASSVAHLLPNYDEYFIGFKDRSAIAPPAAERFELGSPTLNSHILVLDGQVMGGWKRTLKKDHVVVEVDLLAKLTRAGQRALQSALDEYGRFLGLPVRSA